MHRIFAVAGAAFALALTLPVAAGAQEAAAPQATGMGQGMGKGPGMGMGTGKGQPHGHGQMCREAMQKLCPGHERGSDAFRECVFSKADQLPETCRGGPGQGPHGIAACKGDIESHCAEVERGAGRILTCLEEHRSELTPDCAGFVERARTRHDAMKAAKTPKPPAGGAAPQAAGSGDAPKD